MGFDYKGTNEAERAEYEAGRRRRERHRDLVELLQEKTRKLGLGNDAVWDDGTANERVSVPVTVMAKLLSVKIPEES